jgi:hypothetical protein
MNKRIQGEAVFAKQSCVKRHCGRFGLIVEKFVSQSHSQNIFDIFNLKFIERHPTPQLLQKMFCLLHRHFGFENYYIFQVPLIQPES